VGGRARRGGDRAGSGSSVKVLGVVGARPNFMKMAPLMRELRGQPDVESILVHTGQHYDGTMAGQFFEQLQLPTPDVALDVGSGTHAYQTAEVMKRLEPVLERMRPHVVVVVGDVNSTVAAALTAVKLGIPVAHVEAGLRSFDRSMPEEINRLLTDAISEYLFVSEQSGRHNLVREGVDPDKIHFVGNVMIDCLELYRPLWDRSDIRRRLGLDDLAYGLVTLHRPSNVDDGATLENLVTTLAHIARRLPLVFPVHPRTRQRLATLAPRLTEPVQEGGDREQGIIYVEPLGYLDFMALVASARMVLTDSGGLQEETTALGVPCLTLRDTTERPVTVALGTNRVVGTSPVRILEEASRVLSEPVRLVSRPPLWDGGTARRIVSILRLGPAGLPRRRAKKPAGLVTTRSGNLLGQVSPLH
jgi:UDP-N-acetylglucosamine 2-epimerase (non-hydrolysing)